MNTNPHQENFLQDLTHTLLYEGYSLYPYRPSALKNKTPIPFGVLYPEMQCRRNEFLHYKMQTQCILKGSPETRLITTAKFLQTDNSHFDQNGWQAIEREIQTEEMRVDDLIKKGINLPFNFINNELVEKKADTGLELYGRLMVHAKEIPEKQNIFRITVRIFNETEVTKEIPSNEIFKYAFTSTHLILKAERGEFISDQNPPNEWTDWVRTCRNENTWPVLIDDQNSILLSSPIILYDYPKINTASHGDLFDSTEIEEALLLHLNVLTEKEKEEALKDGRVNNVMEKMTPLTPEKIISLHDQLQNNP